MRPVGDVDSHQALGVERCPANKERHHHSNCNQNKTKDIKQQYNFNPYADGG